MFNDSFGICMFLRFQLTGKYYKSFLFQKKSCLLLLKMTTRRTKQLLYVKERKAKFATRQTTRAEILHVEEEG